MVIIREKKEARRLTEYGGTAFKMNVSSDRMKVSIDVDIKKVISYGLKDDLKRYGLHKLPKDELIDRVLDMIQYYMRAAADNEDHQLAQMVAD